MLCKSGWRACVFALLTFGAGIVVGIVVDRRHLERSGAVSSANSESPKSWPVERPQLDPKVIPAPLETTESLSPPASDPPALRISSLQSQIGPLCASRDVAGLLRVLRGLALVGDPGYPPAMELAAKLLALSRSKENPIGLTQAELIHALSGQAAPFFPWVFAQGATAPQWLRLEAVGQMLDNPDLDCAALFFAALPSEEDATVALSMSFAIRHRIDLQVGQLPALVAVLRAIPESDSAARYLVEALAFHGSAEAWSALVGLADGSGTAVAREAAFEIRRVRPPVAGMLVVWVQPTQRAAPLRRGDIVVSCNGDAPSSPHNLEGLLASACADTPVSLRVDRESRLEEMILTAPHRSGITFEEVRPR